MPVPLGAACQIHISDKSRSFRSFEKAVGHRSAAKHMARTPEVSDHHVVTCNAQTCQAWGDGLAEFATRSTAGGFSDSPHVGFLAR